MRDERANERPYVRAMRPLIEAMVRVAPDVLATEAGRATPDVWQEDVRDGLEAVDLADALSARFKEDLAIPADVADHLEQLGREAGIEIVALARAVGLASEALQLADVELRDRLAGGALLGGAE